MERPSRLLIEIVRDIDEELLKQVSPDTLTMKKFIKWPMMFLIWASSMQSSLSVVMLKLFGEII